MKRILLLGIAIAVLLAAGCRTGEYRFDTEIYAAMPALIEANPDLASKFARNEDGTLGITFEKGEMYCKFAYGLDPNTQMNALSDAFQIFHDQYINREDTRWKDGTFRRESIRVRGLVDDTELYVVRWDLADAEPDLESSRQASYY
jgi:hypothetical protein